MTDGRRGLGGDAVVVSFKANSVKPRRNDREIMGGVLRFHRTRGSRREAVFLKWGVAL